MCGYFIHCYAAIFLHHRFNCCNDLWCHHSVWLSRSRSVCYKTNAVHELLSSLVLLLYWQTCFTIVNYEYHSSMNFDGFYPLNTLFFFGACCKRGGHLNTSTAPSCCVPASYCHLSATFQTMRIIVVNLQDNRALFRIFIAVLKF
jgi:hypothetical protein